MLCKDFHFVNHGISGKVSKACFVCAYPCANCVETVLKNQALSALLMVVDNPGEYKYSSF